MSGFSNTIKNRVVLDLGHFQAVVIDCLEQNYKFPVVPKITIDWPAAETIFSENGPENGIVNGSITCENREIGKFYIFVRPVEAPDKQTALEIVNSALYIEVAE
ncbi:hypothetical protein D6827_01725 [Candidatus Parcubacteria bacterium]|nr:MAG: hypothetical protein D6827_01725 [Candidatus Parcubacteria bacterium]